MNNSGLPAGAVAGVTGLIGGSGIVCAPNPISRTGTVSLSPSVTATIAQTANKVQNVEATGGSTQLSGSFQVNDLNVDPFYIVDPTATLVVHGATVSVANLQPISSAADIGTETTPFSRVYADYVDCKNVTTESTNLNALAVATSNNTTLIAGLGTVTQNQTSAPDVTTFAGQVNANEFVKINGTSNQFLMADGSTLENSNTNANSNIYLYNFSTLTFDPPNAGEVRFNATTLPATSILWLNHLTREGVDIHQFLSLITSLSVVYIQQENDANNYVKFNVNATPSLPEPHVFIQLDVTFLEGGGTGLTNFGNGTEIFVSIFTNDHEIDTRLSVVESRTTNINSFATQTRFAGIINMLNSRIINLPSPPISPGDAVSVAYLQGQIEDFVTQAQVAGEFLSIADATLNYALISSLTAYLTQSSAASTYATQTDLAQKLNLTGGVLTGSLVATQFIRTGGSTFDFLKADGSVSQPEGDIAQRLNSLYYDVTTGLTSFAVNMESWRYLSWGYVAPTTVSVVDCVTTLMTHQGGSLAIIGINAALAQKGYKVRVGSNVSSTTNGATSGWLGAAVQNFIIPRAGWYIKIGFSIDATTGTGTNRTMIGLFQSNTRPVLDNTTTIASVVTGSMGIVQEKGETVFSFNTRGPSGSTKIPTTISCDTSNNWYTLEMINEPRFTRVTLILTCQSDTGTQTASTSFICGGANTMSIATAWVHLQQSMASPGGVANSAFLTLGNITMKLAQ